MESLLRFPITAPITPEDQRQNQSLVRVEMLTSKPASGVSLRESEPRKILSGRFYPAEKSPTLRRYRRAYPEPEGRNSSLYHVAEVQEQKYSDRERVVQALLN
ncbi:MAG: hypothetical protein ACK56I_05320, partial [bacterium]